MSSIVPAIVAYNAAISEPDTPSASPEDVGAKAHHAKNAKGFVNPWPRYLPPSRETYNEMLIAMAAIIKR